MKKVQIIKDIQAPQEKVWNYISDIEKAPEWVVVMQELVNTTENPVRKGTVYREKSKIGPKESETTWKVSSFDPPAVQIHECSEPDFKAILTMQVDGKGDKSTLIHTTEYALMPKFRPLGWLLESVFIHRTMEKNLRRSVQICKEQIENEA